LCFDTRTYKKSYFGIPPFEGTRRVDHGSSTRFMVRKSRNGGGWLEEANISVQISAHTHTQEKFWIQMPPFFPPETSN
jgi:hypothetical protein